MRPIPYGAAQRFSDWYHGWRDGVAAVPAKPPRGAPARPATTPHREALIRKAQDAFVQEKLAFEAARAAPLERLTAALARARLLREALARADERLAEPAPRPRELARRRLGEDRHDENVIVERRLREYHRRLAAAREEARRLDEHLAEAEAAAAAARREIEQLRDVAVARVRRIHEHTHRRLAVYRRRLVRSHPNGAWVNLALSVTDPRLPGWALPDVEAEPEREHAAAPDERDTPDEARPQERPPAVRTIRLVTKATVFGSDPSCDVVLASPLAAPRHFTVVRERRGIRLRTHGHEHGPYVDGQPVVSARLGPDDHFDFADRRYTVLSDREIEEAPLGRCDLVVADVSAVHRSKVLLTGMSFVQREGTLLAVLGPSGAGKSSLFHALSGDLPIEPGGRIFFLGLALGEHLTQIREHLGFVPQHDHLHDALTVRRVLHDAFRLRSPARRPEREERIRAVCRRLGLSGQLDQLVGTLSGGERKRVSIAMELLTEPRLLMLDEPTSGLDPGMDRDVMQVLRDYAAEGNTVIVVTHATEHLRLAHQMLVVMKDGRPVFSGPPRRVRRRLRFSRYADLMKRLTGEEAATYAQEYAGGAAAREAVREAERAETACRDARRPVPGPKPIRIRRHPVRTFVRRLGVLIARQRALLPARGQTRNPRDRTAFSRLRGALVAGLPLIIAAGAASLAAVVTTAPGLSDAPTGSGMTALSLLTTLCLLSGQALTYSDIVSEYEIIRREHRGGTPATVVTLSKWLVFAVVAVLQAVLITAVFCLCGLGPARSLVFPPAVELGVDLAALSVTAMTLGMLISVIARRLEQAVAIITAVSIAQIALNGVTSDLSQNTVLGALAWPLPARWGLAAAASSADLRTITAVPPGGVPPRDALWTHQTAQWLTDLAALGVLTVVFFVLATVLLRRRLKSVN
ncbi:MAG TPA: ATP-binding cassette domain-containing protein [Spirillospora sp.]